MSEHKLKPLTGQAFWDRLSEASKVVETWPDWMKGSRENKREARVAEHNFLPEEEISQIKRFAVQVSTWEDPESSLAQDVLRILYDLEAMREKYEAMRDAHGITLMARNQDEAELDRLRKALEDAPHGVMCQNDMVLRGKPCDCWKSSALNPQPTEAK